MPSSTLPAFLSTLRTNLAARPALANVRVDLVATGDLTADESIILVTGPISGDQEYGGAAFSRRLDQYTIPCALQTYSTSPDTDVALQAAFDRAATILDEVVQELRDNKPSVGNFTLRALVTDITYDPFPSEKGGWKCVCKFAIEYQAHVA